MRALHLRPLTPDDAEAICGLVDADRLPGQPPCTTERAHATLAGRVEEWSWSALRTVRAVGATDDGALVGAGAIGTAASGVRHVLWLHAREDRHVVDAIVVHLLRGLRSTAPVAAFALAGDLAPGLSGLPVRTRAATVSAFVSRGFEPEARGLYLAGPAGGGPPPGDRVRSRGAAPDMRVEVHGDDGVVAAAEVSVTGPSTGIIWWLEVDAAHRRRGYGREVFRAACHALAGEGVDSVTLYIDDPESGDRRAALALYQDEGFSVVDELAYYRRGDPKV